MADQERLREPISNSNSSQKWLVIEEDSRGEKKPPAKAGRRHLLIGTIYGAGAGAVAAFLLAACDSQIEIVRSVEATQVVPPTAPPTKAKETPVPILTKEKTASIPAASRSLSRAKEISLPASMTEMTKEKTASIPAASRSLSRAKEISLPAPTKASKVSLTTTKAPTTLPSVVSSKTEKQKEIVYPIWRGNRSRSEVTLTFDDGFDRSSIERTLEALKREGIQATFFVVGRQLEAYPDLWQEAVRDGHQICNHTYNHTWLTSLSDEGIQEELSQWEISAAKVLGTDYVRKMKKEFPFIRLPGGAGSNDTRVLEEIKSLGYIPIGWSDDSYSTVLKNHDLKNEQSGPIAKEVVQHIVGFSENGDIILLHFNKWDTQELEAIIEGIRQKKLNIVTLPQILD